jgi:membrane-bound lytic murein transglycosylase A
VQVGDGTTAAALGVVRGPQIGALQVDGRKAKLAMESFKTSCPGLVRRTDNSGLTQASDWVAACDAAKTWTGDAISFFAMHMDAVQVGDGKAFATGYFEPEIPGCRSPQAGCNVPVYKRPADLIDVDLGLFSEELKGKSIRGKVSGTKFVQYDDRAAIENESLAGRGLEIAYAADAVEFFFLQIQGSGRLKLPDGGVMRIGYESQNGRGYTGIGRLMRDRGLITDASMQGIVAYLRANPEEGRKIMQENKSYIFFRELTGAGPLGAMGYPVVGEASIAVDVKYIPLGAPIWLSMDRAEPNGIWVAQDTGGAIKGANRVDTFWGAGDRARAIAGGMAARGAALIFLPKVSVTRLGL